MRFNGLGSLPPSLFHDEAAIGLDALDILRTGQIPIYFERTTGGQEPLFGYLTALSMLLLGADLLAMRVVAPVVGLLTVAVAYALGREMLGRWVGLIAALLMAVSYWHVHESHTSFRAITLPLLMGLTFLLLWRALRKGTWGHYALAGLSAAATMYTYQSSRLFPLLLALALLYLWICPVGAHNCAPLRRGIAVFAGTMVALTMPLVIYYIGNPMVFSARIEQVGAGGLDLLDSLTNTLGMFSLQGDITWKFNLPGKPVFDPFVSVLFYLGILVAIWRWRQPAYGVLLLWMVVMLLPTALSTESPHFLRAMGIMPAVFVLPGIGATWLAGHLQRLVGGLAGGRGLTLAYLALAAWLAVGALVTYRDYFVEWASSPYPYEVYGGDVEAASRYLTTLEGTEIVMLSSRYYLHYTTQFFERRALDMRWFDGRQSLPLPEPDQSRDVVYVFTASAMPPQAMLDVLGTDSLVKEGRGPQGQLSFQVFRLDTEKLARARERLSPLHPLSSTAGKLVELVGYQLGVSTSVARPEVMPGDTLPLTVYWRVLARTEADFSFFSHLLDSQGRMWGQGDGNEYWSPEWRPGDLVIGRYDIKVDPKAPAGRYTVEVGLFDRSTGIRLKLSEGGEAQPLEAVKVLQVSQPSLDGIGQALGLRLGDNIELLGFQPDGAKDGSGLAARVRPGETLGFTFFWRASATIRDDYTVFLHLLDSSGRLIFQADSQPQGGAFPTSFWNTGEVVADRIALPAPRDMPPGFYNLRLGLYQPATGQRLAVTGGAAALGDQASLGQVNVAP